MIRYANVIALKPEKEAEYRELHRAVWPTVLAKIAECNIRNYSIFLNDSLLFAYFEYHGEDFEADSAKVAADPETQSWWKLTDPCQEPVGNATPGQWWVTMEEVFHVD
ncbi:MAG: L-rhamnose mutarotase [Fimbriimonadaceae bacterium]